MKELIRERNKLGGITVKEIEKPDPKPEPDFVVEALKKIAKKLGVDLSDLETTTVIHEEPPVGSGGSGSTVK